MENPIAYIQVETNKGTYKFEITPNKGVYRVQQVLPTTLTLIFEIESFDLCLEIITEYLFQHEIEILN